MTNQIKLIQGDCIDMLKTIDSNSIDAIVTDPPYELGFMGKSWDNTGIANNVEMWKECLRVLKPGGHLLSFGGTRTYHRMASAIEDAGFEVRDMIEWVYGSGFPKSLNIGKAVDKLQGNEREVTGKSDNGIAGGSGEFTKGNPKSAGFKAEFEITKGNSEWEGWGTALKPAHESIMLAQKPLTSVPLFDKIDIDLIIKKILCLLVSNVKIAESNSVLSQRGLSEELNIAQWIAEENTNTQDALSVLTDMLLLESKINTNLNIVILWLNILEDIYQLKNKFTTLTEISLTIELKILESLEWENIFQNITQAKDKTTDGKNVNVLTAVNLFNAVRLKLNHILTHFAQDPAILKDEYSDIRPNHEPICMARKPLDRWWKIKDDGKKVMGRVMTVAENCLKWGTGGINIDESRVGSSEKLARPFNVANNQTFGKYEKFGNPVEPLGRFPANLIHDNSEEVRECFPNTNASKLIKGGANRKAYQQKEIVNPSGWKEINRIRKDEGYDDNGGNASRFFKSIIYQAKASKSERNKGLDSIVLVDIIKLCNENNTTKEEKLIRLMVTGISPQKVIAESGVQLKNANEWNTCLFGKHLMEKYQEDIKSITKTETNSITTSQTLNWLTHLLTNEYTVGVNLEMGNGGNLVENAVNSNTLIITINEAIALALGVKDVVSGMQLKINVKEGSNIHSTVKPIALMEYLINMVTREGQTVLDMFMGSGTTGVACKNLNRNFIGIEKEEEYFKIANARIYQEETNK